MYMYFVVDIRHCLRGVYSDHPVGAYTVHVPVQCVHVVIRISIIQWWVGAYTDMGAYSREYTMHTCVCNFMYFNSLQPKVFEDAMVVVLKVYVCVVSGAYKPQKERPTAYNGIV